MPDTDIGLSYMKICINSGCRHELEDYQERCPYCGWSQKTMANSDKTVAEDNLWPECDEDDVECEPCKERHTIVTLWLYFALVTNAIMCLIDFFPKIAWGKDFPDSAIWMSVVSGVFGIVNIIAIVMLLNWKRIGFWLLVISSFAGLVLTCVANIVLSVLTSSFPWGVVGIFVWFGILQIRKNGKSCWEQLS